MVSSCASTDLMSNAEQMTQHGLEQSQLWHSVANQSSELRVSVIITTYRIT